MNLKELSNLGIHRMYLNIIKKGLIERIGNGIYKI